MDAKLKVYTVVETANALRVSVATVRRLIDSKKLPALRVGRSIRIQKESLERFLAKGGVK